MNATLMEITSTNNVWLTLVVLQPIHDLIRYNAEDEEGYATDVGETDEDEVVTASPVEATTAPAAQNGDRGATPLSVERSGYDPASVPQPAEPNHSAPLAAPSQAVQGAAGRRRKLGPAIRQSVGTEASEGLNGDSVVGGDDSDVEEFASAEEHTPQPVEVDDDSDATEGSRAPRK